MKYTYIDYGKNLLNEIKNRKPNKDTIIVFSDYFFKNSYMKNRKKNILVEEPTYMTLDEFQKEIFITNKMILSEAKRPLTLFKVLDEELKKDLGVENYYDIIDIADLFFNYYREINFSLIKEIKGLEKWQEELFFKYKKLKNKYDLYLQENDFIPSDWIENINNYNDIGIKRFTQIIFADIPYFTPLIREVIKKLSRNYEIEIIIQIPKEDYDENLLKIEKVSFVKDEINLKIFENSDEMSEIINLIYYMNLKKKKFKLELFSPIPEKNNYSKIFPKYFISQKLNVLDDTLLYRFMKLENQLLLSIEPKKNFSILSSQLKKALNNEIFKKIYGIDEKILEVFKVIFSLEYRYIGIEIFENNEIDYLFKKETEKEYLKETAKVFFNIYNNLNKIKKFETVSDFVEYLKELDFKNFREENYIDIIEKFYEVIENIKSSEILCGNLGFKSLFKQDIGINLYTLLIKYMEGIEIREVEKDLEDSLGIIKNLNEARLHSEDSLNKETYFIDINNSFLPGNLNDKLNFTENQRVENSFMTFEEKKILLKYRFVQGIFNSKKAVIFSRKSINNETDRSIFLEEILLKYNIEIEKENFLSKQDVFRVLYSNFLSFNKLEKQEEVQKNVEYFNLEKEFSDFQDNKIVLGTYDIINLRECEYKYFFDRVVNLHKENEEDYGTSLRFLGVIIHKIFEKISNKIYLDVKNKNSYIIDEDEIDKIIYKILRGNNLKIPTYMDLYFQEILFPKVKKNIIHFYKKIEKEMEGREIKIFWGEKGRIKKLNFINENIDIFIAGRADLIVESYDDKKIIVDYKTGGKKAEQLDIYSIIMYGDENKAEKIIYNAIKGEYEKINKVSITKEELKNIFKDFVKNKFYRKASKKISCNNCEYLNICRREEI